MEQTLTPDFPNAPAREPNASAREDTERQQAGLTVEHLLYLLALLVAFGLRFLNLGQTTLSPYEAAQAWPAFLSATGAQVANAPPPSSALLYGLQSWLFLIAGGGDTVARLLPALAGTALVLLPWWWRQWLGRTAALVVAGLLAVDPWLAALSHTSDGAMLSIFLGLLALTALWQWLAAPHVGVRTGQAPDVAVPHVGVRTGQKSSLAWERTLAVSLALLLVSGPLAWSWLPVLALFAWLCLRSARGRAGWTADAAARVHRSTWLWFAAALLLGATGFLAWPGAFGALGTSLSGWLAQWSGGDSGFGLGWPFLRLAVDQPLLLVFGPLGLLFLALSRGQKETSQEQAVYPREPEIGIHSSAHPLTRSPSRHLAIFLSLWTAWGLLLLLLPGRSAFVLPMLGLPLAIAAAVLIAWLIELPLVDVGGLEITVLLLVAAVLLIAGSIWLAMAVESASYDTRLAVTAAVLVGLTLAIWVVFGFWAGWRAAAKLAGLFFAAVLLLVTVRSTFLLVQPGGRMAPDGLFAVTTLPEARLLANDVQRLSSLRFGDPHQAPVQVATGGQAPDPLVGWLLRDMVDLTWVTAPDPAAIGPAADGTARSPLIVAPASMAQDPGLGGLIGSEYPLTLHWDPSLLPSLPAADEGNGQGLPAEELARLRAEQAWGEATRPQLEWLLYRTIKTEPPVEGVTLWATPAE